MSQGNAFGNRFEPLAVATDGNKLRVRGRCLLDVSMELLSYLRDEFDGSDWDYMSGVLGKCSSAQEGNVFFDGDCVYFKRLKDENLVEVGVSYRKLKEDFILSELQELVRSICVPQLQ